MKLTRIQVIHRDGSLKAGEVIILITVASGHRDVDLQNYSILADPMLEKVFFNLLDNALRHGETVYRIQVSAREEGGDLIVVWEDNGVGIAKEDKDMIFDRSFG